MSTNQVSAMIDSYIKSFKDGDVVKYRVTQSHCREGMAICESGQLLDTFWHFGDRHELNNEECNSVQFMFNLREFVSTNSYEWVNYLDDDKGLVTHQHGLSKDYFLRKGAKRSLEIMIKNAEIKIIEAEKKLLQADNELRWRKDELTKLLTRVE